MKDGKHVVLCVDDDVDMLDALKILVESFGYSFVSASSAEEGLKMFKSEKPDLVMADLMMEEVDSGTGLAKDLKLAGCSVPIFLLSSVGDALRNNANYADLSLTGVFQKPIQPDVLARTLKKELGS
ncbi:MAG: response regulator [Candidatus Sabulitectum sp.]|nr:response regulator [Candidatus Sabulitectum sp.]